MTGSVPPRLSRARRIGFSAAAIVFALLTLMPGFGIIDFVSGFAPDSSEGGVLSEAYGSVAAILIPAALLVQLHAPAQKIAAMQQAALAVLALAVAGLIATDFYWRRTEYCDCGAFYISVGPMAAFVGVLVALHPSRRKFLAKPRRPSRLLAGLVALAAGPWIAYALKMAANQRADLPPFDAGRNGYGGWTGAAAMAIAIVLVAFLASLRTSGWRTPAWSAGAVAVAWGAASIITPDRAGSGGRVWGALAISWGIAFAVASELQARRTRRNLSPAAAGSHASRRPAAGSDTL